MTGVIWHKQRKKWRAFAFKNGRHLSLGLYLDKADAVAARQAFNAANGYHENHGAPASALELVPSANEGASDV